ncbi:hypothetical protein CC78DRAFT_573833 [Lojkania enalia]|uniref:Uncharacterized protein n=1 Tax=Lojkania enalia TaxID=147567 RepID=A0A9P4NC69_9PLEO|nr:hypothetical protein CC78DRAFT_573833 [Didymosphaeria enalia]
MVCIKHDKEETLSRLLTRLAEGAERLSSSSGAMACSFLAIASTTAAQGGAYAAQRSAAAAAAAAAASADGGPRVRVHRACYMDRGRKARQPRKRISSMQAQVEGLSLAIACDKLLDLGGRVRELSRFWARAPSDLPHSYFYTLLSLAVKSVLLSALPLRASVSASVCRCRPVASSLDTRIPQSRHNNAAAARLETRYARLGRMSSHQRRSKGVLWRED